MHDAVDRTTRLVEEGHESVARTTVRVIASIPALAEPVRTVDSIRRVATSGVLGTIRVVNRVVERITDVGLDAVEQARPAPADAPREARLVPMRSDAVGASAWIGDAALGAVNAAVGDRLHDGDNGLSLGMQLRHGDRYLSLERTDVDAMRTEIPAPSRTLAIFVHGLATTEWSWCLNAEQYHGDPAANFGAMLARDLGYTPVFVRYNTGRHISENGRLLAERLERLVDLYPGPLDEIVLIGHSMGGLVVRSACHYARASENRWLAKVRRVFCLGAPHHGAPLEKFSNAAAVVLASIDAPGTIVTARLLNDRSAGIKDLRYGNVVDEDWQGRDPDALLEDNRSHVPLLDDVAYYFVSATITADATHPVGHLFGDLLVRVPSASGPTVTHGAFRIETRGVGRVAHHQLQNHPDVYEVVRSVCARE